MIRLAWSRLRYRPARGLLIALPAAALGVLAEPSALYGLACALYILAAALIDDGELRTLSWLGWPRSGLAGTLLAGYAMAGLLAGILAAPLVPIAGTAAAPLIALGLALAAGVGSTVRLDQGG